MAFKLETHLHTSEGSRCASASGALQAVCRKKEGYDAIIVTDHFYRGNTAADRNLPWEEFVDSFCTGYENARKKGEEIGLKVFFGWEECFDGADMLIYGLDKEWLKKHPEMIKWSPEENYYNVRAAGGFVVQAHPYRMRSYIKGIRLFPEYCDAVEVENKCNYKIENVRAVNYAKDFGLRMTGGSDIHHTESLNGGVLLKKSIDSVLGYYEALKSSKSYRIL